MKIKNRVYLAAIRRDMQARFHFENRNEAFETFWYGWTHQRMRRTGCDPSLYIYMWKRGWIKKKFAEDFWHYICE